MSRVFEIHGATIIDGTGSPGVISNVRVRDDRIDEIGSFQCSTGAIDGSGLVVAPGFIDTHTHDDVAVFGDQLAKISQGVTSVVTGNCGLSVAPFVPDGDVPEPLNEFPADSFRYPIFEDYLRRLDADHSPTNVIPLVGHSTLRAAVLDRLDRPATSAEVGRMCERLDAALSVGARGWSSGLEYAPAKSAEFDELLALARVGARHGAVYTSHMRDEADAVIEAMTELFAVAQRSGGTAIISHHKCSGRANFGRSTETLPHFDAHASSLDIGMDAYPYDACSTILNAEFAANAIRTMIASSGRLPSAAGRYLDDLATEWNVDTAEAIRRLSPAGAVYFDMDEADVQRILRHPSVMIGSDGLPSDAHPHPRLWGTFARVLGHYARDLGLFTIEEAIRKMTSLPARRFGLENRGLVAPGYRADLVLFDPARIIDTATFDDPVRAAEGVTTVWVNGEVVYTDGGATGNRPGGAL